jgi:hypothetical protein
VPQHTIKYEPFYTLTGASKHQNHDNTHHLKSMPENDAIPFFKKGVTHFYLRQTGVFISKNRTLFFDIKAHFFKALHPNQCRAHIQHLKISQNHIQNKKALKTTCSIRTFQQNIN